MTSKIVLPVLTAVASMSLVVLAGHGRGAAHIDDVAGAIRAATGVPPAIYETQILTASDATQLSVFGRRVCIDRNHAIVGAHRHTHGGVDTGAAYVYRRLDNGTPFDLSDDTWAQQAELRPSDGQSLDYFGYSVAITETHALVGAPFDDDYGASSGSAYVYRLEDNGTPSDSADDTWVEEAKLTAIDLFAGHRFGFAVAIQGSLAVVGAPNHIPGSSPGAAYLFRLNDNGTPSEPDDDAWALEARLVPDDSAEEDQFGKGVAIQGMRVVVGAPTGTDGRGAAYVFRRDDGGTPEDPNDDAWIQEGKLTASDGDSGDRFGLSVSLWDKRVVVGAFEDQDYGVRSGSAYVYRLEENGTPLDPSDDVWIEETKLLSWDGAPDAEFGHSVSLFGTHLIVGADSADRIGAGYAFHLDDSGTPFDPSDDSWVPEVKLIPSDGGGSVGHGASLFGECAILGAPDHSGAVLWAGAAYVFVLAPDALDLADFALFQGCMTSGGEEPTPQCARFDFDLDGAVNLLDYGEFDSRFVAP